MIGFYESNIIVAGASISSFERDINSYMINLTPDSDGVITVDVNAEGLRESGLGVTKLGNAKKTTCCLARLFRVR